MTIRVYLVHEHSSMFEGLRALLDAESDIGVIGCAGSGRIALLEMKELQPDVVLLDVSMPDIGGIEIAEQLPLVAPDAQVVLLLTVVGPELVTRALRAGVRGYLLKELAGRDAVNAVRAVYAGQFYFSQEVMRPLIAHFMRQGESPPIPNPFDRLSQREREVLRLVVEGWSSARIAERMHLSPKTIETYRSRLMHKLEVTDMPHLMRLAMHYGLVPLD